MHLKGLYLLADESVLPFSQWAAVLPAVLECRPALVQYRAKQQTRSVRLEHARWLQSRCADCAIPLLVNDDPALAAAVNAAGVHVGASDADLSSAREVLGPHAIIGVSCYNDLERAAQLAAGGANYVSFGRLFPSGTKPDAPPAALETLMTARQQLDVAICAIGGIDVSNAGAVLQAGADLICVGGGILARAEPATETRKLATIANEFQTPRT